MFKHSRAFYWLVVGMLAVWIAKDWGNIEQVIFFVTLTMSAGFGDAKANKEHRHLLWLASQRVTVEQVTDAQD